MDRLEQIDIFSRFTKVSRETINKLTKYEEILIKANKSLNLIGKSTIKTIWHRHILDSFQIIDFIDKNDENIVDLGSGAGFPGIIIAIAASERKIPLKIKLLEKSSKKANFLEQTIKELNLNVSVICKDVFDDDEKLLEKVFVARAFKPLSIILKLIHSKATNWKKLFVFLGKTGKQEILLASKSWDIKYKQRMSVTNKDSFIIEIEKLRKLN